MKIRTRFTLTIWASVIVLVVGFGFTVSGISQVRGILQESFLFDKLVKDLLNLRVLTLEYVNSPSERAELQWYREYENISKERVLSAPLPAEITDAYINMRLIFGQMVKNSQNLSQAENPGRPQEGFQKQLYSTLLIETQRIIDWSQHLSGVSKVRLTSVLQIYSIGAVLLLALVSTLTGFILFTSRNRIVRSISTLEQGAEIISRGGLEHRIDLPVPDEFGELATAFNLMTQALQRKTGELRASEQRLSDLLKTVHLIAVMHDFQGNITFCNDYLLRLTGWSRDEVINKNWFDIFLPEEVRQETRLLFLKALAEGDTPSYQENSIITREGVRHLIQWDNTMLHDIDGNIIGTASIGRDVTEERKIEEQLRQAQKMEAIGALAGGVAHDFNNIMSAIVGYASLLRMKMKAGDPLRTFVEHILALTERATVLTKSLLAFSRKQVIELKPVSLNEIVLSFQKILTRLISEDIEFKVECFPGELIVEADEGQLEQVLMNLATNARDAMPKGGTLRITTGRLTLEADQGEISEGDYAVLTVSDSGTGMDKNTQTHIFEPFFTTKEVGKGTGLGLASVYGIIKKHGGTIHFLTGPGQGTMFRIYLPLVQSTLKEISPAEHVLPPSGTETVLLVEDEKIVRQVTSTMLEEFGYTVLEAADGEEAVKVFRENQDSIRLVLCDLVMPKKNGRETCDEIKKMRPAVETIFMSGYTSDIIAQKLILEEGVNFISKPLNLTDLLRKIREVLGP